MKVLQATQKPFFAAKQLYYLAHIMRHEKHVFPRTAFEGLGRIGCQAAEVGERTACNRVLVAPRPVLVFWLEEAREIRVCAVYEGSLVCFEQVLPVCRA